LGLHGTNLAPELREFFDGKGVQPLVYSCLQGKVPEEQVHPFFHCSPPSSL